MLEWYRVGADYNSLMTECEEMVRSVAEKTAAEMEVQWGDVPWAKLTVAEAFRKYGHCSSDDAVADDLFEEILVEEIEPALAGTR